MVRRISHLSKALSEHLEVQKILPKFTQILRNKNGLTFGKKMVIGYNTNSDIISQLFGYLAI